MQKSEKERVVAELTERLRTSQTLIVADYRGLTNAEIDGLRGELLKHGARFAVVKNTLTRSAAEAAGADALLALLEGPTAIAFLEADGDPVAVAKALGDSARARRGSSRSAAACSTGGRSRRRRSRSSRRCRRSTCCASQVLGAITAPLTTIVGALQRAAAEPDRADRRADRAARGRFGRAIRPRPKPPTEEPAADAAVDGGTRGGRAGRGRAAEAEPACGDQRPTPTSDSASAESPDETEE